MQRGTAAGRDAREHCGLFGVCGHPRAAELTYYGLRALQHRGQESAGIVSTDGRNLRQFRAMGLVADVFTQATIDSLSNPVAIGHVRYSTTGTSNIVNSQPIVVNYSGGQIAVGHNGNLVNANALRAEFEARGSIFRTSTDSEVILHLMASPENANKADCLARCMRQIRGAFALLMLTPGEMIAARDRHGYRPLALGRLGNGYAVASETCAFDIVNAEPLREVEPGEIVRINDKGLSSERFCPEDEVQHNHCIFEHIYFARADSYVFGENVHLVRKRLGARLAEEHPVDADIVIAVPDSANSAALGYHDRSGIRLDHGFARNPYVGRTFIIPQADDRSAKVLVKLNVNRAVVHGQRIVVVDDSIVRGTTTKTKISHLREAGAKEVHLRITCPPPRHPCYYGIDFPTCDELFATDRTLEQMRDYLGVDSLAYLSTEGMLHCVSQPPDHYCTACFTGRYALKPDEAVGKHTLEHGRTPMI